MKKRERRQAEVRNGKGDRKREVTKSETTGIKKVKIKRRSGKEQERTKLRGKNNMYRNGEEKGKQGGKIKKKTNCITRKVRDGDRNESKRRKVNMNLWEKRGANTRG